MKKIFCAAFCSLVYSVTFSDSDLVSSDDIVAANKSEQSSPQEKNSNDFWDGFINIKGAHERDQNNYPFGPRNSSAIAMNPVLQIKNFIFEGDFYYGRQFKYSGALTGFRHLSKFMGNVHDFSEANEKDSRLLNNARKGANNGLGKPHFYRNYTRAVYINEPNDFRVIVGDTATRNTIGFQQILAGAGISIFRQSNDGQILDPGLPIVVTRLSKLEVRLGNEILAVKILAPGVYTVNDFGEEAKIPGAYLKLSDQLSRSEKLKIDYFGNYGMPEAGKDDFDFTIVCPNYWDIDDPHRMRYRGKPKYSANYRYGLRDTITLGVGAQFASSAFLLDNAWIFATPYGKIAPNIGYSYEKDRKHGALGAGLYYALPENQYDFHAEIFCAATSKGHGDLSKSSEQQDDYNSYINKYFSHNAALPKLLNSSEDASSRQVVARIYTKSIYGFIPAFIFKGMWITGSQRLREYTLAITKKIGNCMFTISGGLTYDDPDRGVNQKSPDRRLTAACSIDINSEFSVKSTYGHYDDEMRRSYGSVTYTPEAIKGLELCAEYTRKPGLSNPVFSAKYDGKYFDIKVEEAIADSYADKGAKTRNGHKNGQRVLAGTCFLRKGFGSYRKSSINVLRKVN